MSANEDVELWVQTTFLVGPLGQPVKGYLGIGKINGKPVFGQVLPGGESSFRFSHRCYYMDDHLNLDQLEAEGLLLDIGGANQQNRMIVTPEEMTIALDALLDRNNRNEE